MPEQPSPQPALTVEDRRDRVQARLNQLEGVVEAQQIEQLRMLLEARAARPPRIELEPGQIKALSDRRAELHVILEDSKTLELLVTGLEQVLDHLEANRGRYNRQRLNLLLQVVNPKLHELLDPFLKHQEDVDKLTGDVTGNLRGKLKLNAASEPLLRLALTEGPPAPPADADAVLTAKHAAITARWRELLPVLDGVLHKPEATVADLKAWTDYETAVGTFERECREAGFLQFKKDVGFPSDMPQEDLDAFTRDILSPLPAPETCRDEATKKDPAKFGKVREAHAYLEGKRQVLSGGLREVMRFSLPRDAKQAYMHNLINFMMARGLYERKLLKQESQMDKWAMYAGVVLNELAEEAAEGSVLKFGKEPAFLRVGFMEDLNAAARKKLAGGWKELVKTLEMKGVNPKSLDAVVRYMNKTPLGPKFWGELIKVESPVTVMLWGYFMFSAENKTKAFIQFGTFLAMSGAGNQLMELAEMGMRDAAAAELRAARALAAGPARAKAIADAERKAQTLARMARVPGHPAVKFGLMIAAAIAFNEEIDQICTWIDKQIPDSQFKTDLGTTAGLFLGEPLFVYGGELTDNLGVTRVDPSRDLMTYLAAETFNDNENGRFDRMYHHTIDDWNARVDQVIALEEASGARRNPVLIALLKTNKIQDVSAWGERQSVTLFYKAVGAKGAEDALAAALIAKGVLKEREDLNGLRIATSDNGDKRNDRSVAYAFGTGQFSPGIKAVVDALKDETKFPKDDPIRKQWQEYEALLKEIAKDVSVYRHINVYKQADWLGDVAQLGGRGQMPPAVQRGMIEEIRHRANRAKVTNPSNFPNLQPGQYGAWLAGAVKTEEKLGFMAMLGDGYKEFVKDYKAGIDLRPSQVTGAPEWSGGKREELFILMTACDQAGRILPKPQFEALMKDVQALVLKGDVATIEEIRDLRNKVTEAVMNHRMAAAQLSPVGDDLRTKFAVPAGAPFFVQGSYSGGLIIPGNGLAGDRRVDIVASLASNIRGGRQPAFSDVRVFQGDASSTGTMRFISFSCPSGDRSRWEVRIHSVRHDVFYVRTSTGTSTNSTIKAGDTRTIPYNDWVRGNAPLQQALEPEFAKIQAQRQQADERYRALAAERRLATQREADAVDRISRSQGGLFTDVSGIDRPADGSRRYRMSYNGAIVTTASAPWARQNPYNRPATHASVSDPNAPRGPRFKQAWDTDFHQPYESDAVSFTVERDGRARELRVANYDEFTRLSATDKALFLDLITTPLEGGDDALVRIINLFPHQFHDGGSEDRHVSRDRLRYILTPRYMRANGIAQKQKFLRDLWNDLTSYTPTGVYFSSVDLIRDRFKDRTYGDRGPTLVAMTGRREGVTIGGKAVKDFWFQEPPSEFQRMNWSRHVYLRDELQVAVAPPPSKSGVPVPLQASVDGIAALRAQVVSERARLAEVFARHADSFETPLQTADIEAAQRVRQLTADYYKACASVPQQIAEFAERQRRYAADEQRLISESGSLWARRAPPEVQQHVFMQASLLGFRRQLLAALETGKLTDAAPEDPFLLVSAWGMADAPHRWPLFTVTANLHPRLLELQRRRQALAPGAEQPLTDSDRAEFLALFDEATRMFEASRVYDRTPADPAKAEDIDARFDIAALQRDASSNALRMTTLTDRLKGGRGRRMAELDDFRRDAIRLGGDVRATVARTMALRDAMPPAGTLRHSEARDREWAGRIPLTHMEWQRSEEITEDNRIYRYHAPTMLFTDGVEDTELAFLTRLPEMPKVLRDGRAPLAAIHVRKVETEDETVFLVGYLYALPGGQTTLLQRAVSIKADGAPEVHGLTNTWNRVRADSPERDLLKQWGDKAVARQKVRNDVETAALTYWKTLRPIGMDKDGHEVYGVRYGLSTNDIKFVMVRFVGPGGVPVPPPGALPPGAQPPMKVTMQYVVIDLGDYSWNDKVEGIGDVAKGIMDGKPGANGQPVAWAAMDAGGPDIQGFRARAKIPGTAHPDLLELTPQDRMNVFIRTLARPGINGVNEDPGDTAERAIDSLLDTSRVNPAQLARLREMARRVRNPEDRQLFMQVMVEQLAKNEGRDGLDLNAILATETKLQQMAETGLFGEGLNKPNFQNLDQTQTPTPWPPPGGVIPTPGFGGPGPFPGAPGFNPGMPQGPFPGQPGVQPLPGQP